jgi:acyl carrier protein
MKTKEEILSAMSDILATQFEIDRARIKPTAQLFLDLDLDSIDAVDLVVTLQKLTGKKIDPAQFKQVRTIQDVVDAIYSILNP